MENEESQPKSIEAAQKKEQLKNRVLKTGESFGNYRVVKCISSGLIAHYYHMQHIRDLHDVTVGVFHYRTDGSEGLLKRLDLLQKMVDGFDHEAFPTIRDCTRIKERICIFLDPVQGLTLSEYFERNGGSGSGGIGASETLRIVAQLYGALGYAHSKAVDHRDLESDLIFMQEDGSIRILGLGIKAALGVELFESIVSASVSPLVSSKQIGRLNSFDVMSPEYRSGVKEDARVDVYGVGFLGYWLLTGSKADAAKYQPPTTLVEELASQWDVFFEQSLERSADKRYQSCRSALIGLKKTNDDVQSDGVSYVQRQIDRIPVPKQIVERGVLATRIYRLFIIGLVGLTLTAICASYLTALYTEEEQGNRVVAEVATSSESASLQLSVKPPVARVEFVGQSESFVASKGTLNLAVLPGDYKLRISARHHIEQIVDLSIQDEASAPEVIDVELRPAWTDFVIQTEPGASVSVIDAGGVEIELGVADAEGILSVKKGVFAGVYDVLVKKDGYMVNRLEDQTFELATETQITAPLSPLPARLSLSSQPLGARILVNDIELGTTPLDLEDIVPDDEYLIIARLEGYRPIARRIEVAPGAEMAIDLGQFVPLSGALGFELEVRGNHAPELSELQDELTVFLDGTPIPFGDKTLEAVPVGRHRIHLEHPLYTSEELAVNVKDKVKYALKFALNPRPAHVQLEMPGNLAAQVRINGESVEVVEGRVRIPANKLVEFELRVRNYLTMMRTFELSPNETFVWQVDPKPIPGPVEGQSWTMPYFGVSLAWIPPGRFEMGSPPKEHARLPNEGPQTSVRFTRGFWAGVYEVTQAQYSEITGRNPSNFIDPTHPVENLTWEEARVFCSLLTDFERDADRLPEGYVYRLPSEAEWEYVARGGTSTPFFFGHEADASMGHFRGVYPRDRRDGLRAPDDYGPAAVGLYQANPFGLHDVHGNVREWTLDRYNGRLAGDQKVDPSPRTDGSRIAVRGGGWEDTAARVRSAAREEISPDVNSDALGFRVVLAPE